jgi:hypothetical protein
MDPRQVRHNFRAGEPGTGAVWRLDSDKLTRSDSAGAESFPLKGLASLQGASLTFNSIAVDGNYVWVGGRVSARGDRKDKLFLARFGRRDQQWTELAPTGLPEGALPYRVMADGESFWIFTPKGEFRLDPKNQSWTPAPKLLGFPESDFRIADAMPDGRYVWFVPTIINQTPKDSAPGVLGRWSRETGETTWLDPLPKTKKTGHALLVENERVWVSTSLGVVRFERGSEKWEPFPFPVKAPADFAWKPERIQYAEGAIWFTDNAISVRWKPRQTK